jgi:nucleotide-binding universal stress UspA family protein
MKILLAFEDSKFSEAALKAIIAHYLPKAAQVRVLHVIQPVTISTPPQMSPGYAPELQGQTKEAETLLQRAAQTLRAAKFQVDTEVAVGDVRERILDVAQNWHADMIVLGSHGRGSVGRFLLGSVAEFVARHAPCSVEIVRTR